MDHSLNYHHCILPPHILKNMAANGSEFQKQIALASMAISGQIRGHRLALAESVGYLVSSASPGKHRTVYTAGNGGNLPGKVVRAEGSGPTGDPATDEAYEAAGATYDFYWEVFQRNSVDGMGLWLDSTVHYQQKYDNAFWNGQQMVYGDGDGQLFNRFTSAVDVIGHELTHGVTQYTCNLSYHNQPGALNEAISDVFGSLVRQYKLKQTADQADWLIGQGLFTANVKGLALRSMKAPGTAYDDPVLGKDPQPATMSGYVTTTQDNGGVHVNSGIPNHAFYLLASALGGFAWEKAGKIWYVAATTKFNSDTDFQGAANLTSQVAGELYGPGSTEQQAVQNAWLGVGITVGAQSQTQSQAQSNGCLPALLQWIFGVNTQR